MIKISQKSIFYYMGTSKQEVLSTNAFDTLENSPYKKFCLSGVTKYID